VFVDMGYAHLQASVVAYSKGKLRVLATHFDNQLGGRDFDRVLTDHFQKDFLARHGATFASEQYDFIVQHQVSALAIHLFSRCGAQVFGQPMPESLSVVEEFGNTATTSHYLVLHQALKEGRLKGGKVLLVPAASGIVVGFVSLTMSSLKVA
jgi:3-oxoacyl-[acyl-carrier-protein] synthase-3